MLSFHPGCSVQCCAAVVETDADINTVFPEAVLAIASLKSTLESSAVAAAVLCVQVAYAWAISLSQEEAATLLRRLNMADAVVEYAVEAGAFAHAFQLAQIVAKAKLPDVHMKYAMYLEDSGRFQEAEGEFVNAGGGNAATL